MDYEPVIGLEIHVQLNTQSKLFCACSAGHFGKKPNSQICPICLGLPGAMPSPPNRAAIKKAVLIAKALGCQLASECLFERKCYFYPDLPKGFQISQHRTAIGLSGRFRGVRIRRVHLEEDAAKLVHEKGQTLVDFNRAGVPLVEIVTEPELKEPLEAMKFLKELQTLFRYLKISNADMEKGSLRLEANISLREVEDCKSESGGLPDYKVELKNINSFKFVTRALEAEVKRQRTLLRRGKKVTQETRGYDARIGKTYPQRRKEEAAEYRYFPEPDLPPITAKLLSVEDEVMLPEMERMRLKEQYGLPKQYIDILTRDPELLALFEEVIKAGRGLDPKVVANVIINRRLGDPKKLGVRGLVRAFAENGRREQLPQRQIERYLDKVIQDYPQAVADYKAGKEKALHFLLGALMRETKGKVDPNAARSLLIKSINRRSQ